LRQDEPLQAGQGRQVAGKPLEGIFAQVEHLQALHIAEPSGELPQVILAEVQVF
jgi:hypothetical protein